MINKKNNYLTGWIADIKYMHKDNYDMLNYIAKRLKIGNVNKWNHFASLCVSRQKELIKLIAKRTHIKKIILKNQNSVNIKYYFKHIYQFWISFKFKHHFKYIYI